MNYYIIAVLSLLQLTKAASYEHLMTINPNDGQSVWGFNSPLWLFGDFGFSYSGKDYISDKIRHIPISKIKITSTNKYNRRAEKEWSLKSSYQGWTF